MTTPRFGSVEYSDEEFNSIQAALRKRLGPEFISTRPGPGGQKLQYVEGWRVVQLANETFGFDSWGYSVTNTTVDFVDHSNGKFYVGVSATVKVTLKNGAFREDVGYGCVDGMRSKSQALEKARKESVTDGLKRALKSFGNLLGNCLSDKEYMKHVARLSKGTDNHDMSMLSSHQLPSLPNFAKQARSRPSQSHHVSITAPSADQAKSTLGLSSSSTAVIHSTKSFVPSANSTVLNTGNVNNNPASSSVDLTLSQLVEGDEDFWDEALSDISENPTPHKAPTKPDIPHKVPGGYKPALTTPHITTPTIPTPHITTPTIPSTPHITTPTIPTPHITTPTIPSTPHITTPTIPSTPQNINSPHLTSTPSRSSPRLNSSKRRRVDIPGLTN